MSSAVSSSSSPRGDLQQQSPTASRRDSTPLEGRASYPLSRIDVFGQMRDKICRFVSPLGKFSGFFIQGNGLIATCMHSIPKSQDAQRRIVCISDNVHMLHNGHEYKVGFPSGFKVDDALKRDLCLLVPNGVIDASFFAPLPLDKELKEGMDVYFAGYPLSHDALTFHQGAISSIYHQNGIQCFTIDGTVVPGNSGGPVVVQIDGEIYLAGVIFSEVTDLDPDFAQVEKRLAAAKADGTQVSMTIGGDNLFDLMSVALSAIKRNMSTGVGRAVHVRHLMELTSGQEAEVPLSGPALEIGPGQQLPVIKVPKELERSLKENGWRHLRNGKGSHMIFQRGDAIVSVPMNPGKGTTRNLLQQIEAGADTSDEAVKAPEKGKGKKG